MPTDVRRLLQAAGRPSAPQQQSHSHQHHGGGALAARLRRCYTAAARWLTEPECTWWPVGCALLAAEAVLAVLVVNRVPYTEIDWRTYMQQVAAFGNGTRNYSLIAGDTGPLVYPAGHVYVYWLLRLLTGGDIRRAQYCFIALYLATLLVVFRLYAAVGKLPPYVLLLMCATSYRVHSIYMLRLFNDPVVVLLVYCCALCLVRRRWTAAAVLYSLSVSVKMNALLFAPAVAALTLVHCGWLKSIALACLSLGVQAIVGAPFLIAAPLDYARGAFNIGRVFLHKWTVNWRFVPEEVFVSGRFHAALLCGHAVTLAAFVAFVWLRKRGGLFAVIRRRRRLQLSPQETLHVLFTANLVGMAWSRSLHYQFYVWYYHSLPFILWTSNWCPLWLRLATMGAVELCWNVYPSTAWSSGLLHAAHAVLLAAAAY